MTASSIGPGLFVALAGPSGVGKDSLLAYARDGLLHCPEIVFARRTITRPGQAGSENHDSLAEHEFRQAEASGGFALSWRSHGFCYGIPAQADDDIRAGRAVVANVSRAVLPEIRARYTHSLAILVTAAPEIITARLFARGRENPAEIDARIVRNSAYGVQEPGLRIIDNSGELDIAGGQLVRILEMATGRRRPGAN